MEGAETEFQKKKQSLLKDLETRQEEAKNLQNQKAQILEDLEKYEDFQKLEWFQDIRKQLDQFSDKDKTLLNGSKIIESIKEKHYTSTEKLNVLKEVITRFTGNFNEVNIFNFPTRFNSTHEFLNFAEELKEFLEEDEIADYESRVNERFAHIVGQIGKETGEMLSKEGEINKVIQKINSDFEPEIL